jgi:hypothetical protein
LFAQNIQSPSFGEPAVWPGLKFDSPGHWHPALNPPNKRGLERLFAPVVQAFSGVFNVRKHAGDRLFESHGGLFGVPLRMGAIVGVALAVGWAAVSLNLPAPDATIVATVPAAPSEVSEQVSTAVKAASMTVSPVAETHAAKPVERSRPEPVLAAVVPVDDQPIPAAQKPALRNAVLHEPLSAASPRWGSPLVDAAEPDAPVASDTVSVAKPELLALAPASDNANAAFSALLPVPADVPVPEKRVKAATKAAAKPAKSGNARVNADVRLRAGPDDETKIVAVVPSKSTVNVLTCKSWCKIAWNGKQGYIFKKFIVRN